MILAALHGVILAFGLILPLGAQNVFVFNQGATQPVWIRALPVVVTAAICDTLLIILAVLGVSLIVLQLQWLQMILFSVGMIFLVYMGWSVWTSDSKPVSGPNDQRSSKQQVAFAMSVSLLNPHAILDTIGVIGTSSLQYVGMDKVVFALACITVSWCWFIGLALAGRWLGKIDSKGNLLSWINKISALIIWGVAIYLAWNLIVG
ncbi:LysE/ArgO family amino acid transporter [Hazenella coriacea]|uniref:L-lysine exporter family protein LysE/ArgO n=1 Tax=Hazenella coriacea TaxID=1179467 RepID=A0A4V2UVE4_9BACL|nr:LysE/ArgO family amino acid transporter [Hazenella coriacea]TCS95457.1 L-lysine exporter family protein LysE/ArgO [Hazenella coriacea]